MPRPAIGAHLPVIQECPLEAVSSHSRASRLGQDPTPCGPKQFYLAVFDQIIFLVNLMGH
jgi:hypothetical protein